MNKLRPLFLFGVVFALLLAGNMNLSAQQFSADTVRVELNVKEHSPHKATLYSALIPGLGQIYNKKYWKVPILYAGIGVTVYAINQNTKNFKKFKNAFRDFSAFYEYKYQPENQDPPIEKPTADSYQDILEDDWETTTITRDNWFQTQLQNKKDSFKRYRDLSYIILAGVYVLNIIDATVDAHFTNFNINEDLTIRMEPAVNYSAFSGNSIGLRCQITF